MELLGENLSELRRRTTTGKFSMATTLQLGIVFIRSLEQMHDLGYLHRDIKPSNFVIGGEGRKNQVFLIDFGLARKYVMPDGSIRPSRDQAGFRGTARYASINSHLSRDLGRRDDLWSVLYMLIEFAKGYLPWRKLKEKDEIRDIKIKMNTPELVDDLPKEFQQFMDHLQALDFADRPDYDYLIQLLQHKLSLIGANDKTPYDWETSGHIITSSEPAESVTVRPDSAGKPVMSADAEEIEAENGRAPSDADPDNPRIYKLVAGRRGNNMQHSEAENAHNSQSNYGTRSGENPQKADFDNSDLEAHDEDDNNLSTSEKQHAHKSQSSVQPPRHSTDEAEMEPVRKSNTGPNRPAPAHHNTPKCKCTIM